MGGEEKKGDQFGSFELLNRLIVVLEEGVNKLEEAYKKNNYEQVKAIKEYLMNIHKKIEEELK